MSDKVTKKDGRVNNSGTVGNKGGRRPRKMEKELIQRLSKFDKAANAELGKAIKKGEAWAIKLFMEYRYGRPVTTLDMNVSSEMEIIWNEVKTYDVDAIEETNFEEIDDSDS